jgi:hypothetical protein
MKVDLQKYNTLKLGMHMIVDGAYSPGKEYTITCKGQENLKAKCTSWYGPPTKSSFLLIEKICK